MNPLSMTIRFNCQSKGVSVITVRIEFEDDTLDAVEFSVVKDNVHSALLAVTLLQQQLCMFTTPMC